MLEGTVSIGITFSEYAQDGDKLTAYVDSDHAHFRNLLESIDEKQKQATVVFEDNSGAASLSRSAKITPRTRHIDVKLHHV